MWFGCLRRPDPEPVSPAPSIETEFSVASGSCGLCRGGSPPFCVVGGLSPWTWVSPWLILDSNSVRICLIWIRGDRRHAGIWIEYRLCPNRARRHPQASLDMNSATGLSPVGFESGHGVEPRGLWFFMDASCSVVLTTMVASVIRLIPLGVRVRSLRVAIVLTSSLFRRLRRSRRSHPGRSAGAFPSATVRLLLAGRMVRS